MRQSKLFTKATKQEPKDETSFNARILIKAGFIDKLGAGIYSFLPLGMRVYGKICQIIREEMNAIGGQEILMPALISKENWQKTKRWDTFGALFKLKGTDKKGYALGSTHEEVVTPLVKKHVFSYKELPVYVYQIQTKFRDEPRAKAGLLRGREFSMKDLYSFHTDRQDLDKYYEEVKNAYFKILERLSLDKITYLTYASGGPFSKYSHEFQTLSEHGEDTIYICKKCKLAINQEIIKEQKKCPNCQGEDFEKKKSIEIANIFILGTRFTEAFGFYFKDNQGKEKKVEMGCYGFGPSRAMGTIVESSHDEKGIIWPEQIAPFKVHLLKINSHESKVDDISERIYQELQEKGIDVLYDDREKSPGEKFAESDLIGIPFRLVISDKTIAKNMIEIKKRKEKEVKMIKIEDLISNIGI